MVKQLDDSLPKEAMPEANASQVKSIEPAMADIDNPYTGAAVDEANEP